MTIKLNVKKGIIPIGVMFLLAITVSYADTQIQREDIKGSFVLGRVQTAQDVILVYSQISPATADLTSLSFGTGDIDAFGALVTAPKVEFWAANGGGTPFNLTLEAADIEINGVPVSGDLLALLMGPPGGELLPAPDHATLIDTGGQTVALEAGLTFLKTPQELGLVQGDRITFTALFKAGALGGPGPGPSAIPPPPGMVSWWPGDGHADDIWDGNPGTLTGDFAQGMVAQAFKLTGSGDFVNLGNASNLRISTGDFTVDAWVRFEELQGDMSIVDKMSASGVNVDGWRFLKWGDNRFMLCFGLSTNGCSSGVPTTVLSSTVASVHVWFHVAATKSASAIAVYVNGVLENTKPLPAFTDTHTASLLVGSYVREGSYLSGLVDEVEIFNRALTAQEIKAIYNARSAGKIKPAPLGAWTTKAPRPVVSSSPSVGAINGLIYTVSGYTGTQGSDLAIYDPVGDSWTTGASRPSVGCCRAYGVIDGAPVRGGRRQLLRDRQLGLCL